MNTIVDFYQLPPVMKSPIYDEYHILWHSLVTKVVKLKTNHRFEDDEEFGELLDRYRNDNWTEEDIKTIISRIIDASTGVMPPNNDDVDVTYACAYNKERNAIATTIFSRHVDKSHPIVKPGDDDESACDGILIHTIIRKKIVMCPQESLSYILKNVVLVWIGELIKGLFLKNKRN